MDFKKLKKYFKQDGEATTYEEFEEAIKADKELKLYDLADGGYVGKDKLDAKIAELATVKKQLEDANTEIKAFKDLDVDGIKKKAEEWEAKYQQETQALQDKLDSQAYEFAIRDQANSIKFTSESARKAFIAEALAKKLAMKGGKVLGLSDFVEEYKKDDPKAIEEEKPEEPEEGAKPRPKFTEQKTNSPSKKLSLREMMQKANEGVSVDSLFK